MEVLFGSDDDQVLLPRRIYGLGPLLHYLKEHRVDCAPLFEIAGILPDSISDPSALMTLQQEQLFNQTAIKVTGDPGLGLAIGPRFRHNAFGILGLALMSSDTLRAGLATCFALQGLTWSRLRWRLLVDNKTAIMEAVESNPLGPCLQYMVERDLSAIARMCDDMLCGHLPLSEASFSYPAPAHAQKYGAVFQCPVNFGSGRNEVRFDASWLDVELPQANPAVCKIFQGQCRELLAGPINETSYTQMVSYMIVDPSGSFLSLEHLAEKLHVSPRTLRRKLAKEGTNFQQLITAVRSSLAKELLLCQELSIEEVAVRLGYSDSTSFHHAFKRWTGFSPRSYRYEQGVVDVTL